MRRTEVLQEIRRMRFSELYEGWKQRRFTQEEAALLLGVSDRTFRRYVNRYEEEGLEGLVDHRLGQVSHRCAPVDEVMALADLYRQRYRGFTVKHFYSWYRRAHQGIRSYTWVKNTLQGKGLLSRAPRRGAHRKRRPQSAYVGMMLHQDGSRHEWVPGKLWDLIVTMDDATGHHSSLFILVSNTLNILLYPFDYGISVFICIDCRGLRQGMRIGLVYVGCVPSVGAVILLAAI